MRMRREIVAGVLLCFLTAPLCAQQTNGARVVFEALTYEDGLSDDRVFEIFQGSRGFLWFGTRNGLNRYDGYTIRTTCTTRQTRAA